MEKEQILERLKSLEAESIELQKYIKEAIESEKTIFEKVVSFKIACEYTGIDPDKVPEHEHLLVILEALNQGQVSNYNNPNEKKWKVWHEFVPGFGFRFHGSYYDFTNTYAGSRLDSISKDIADYAVKNFPTELNNYLLATRANILEKYKK